MKNLVLACLALILTCCGSSGPSFAAMSELELAAYNREQPAEKNVFCVEESSTSTFIRKRVCRSYEDWIAHNERSAMTLDVLNSTPAYSLPNSIQDGPPRN